MAFTVNDIRDLTQLLTLHPEWRAEVRRLVLTDELLALPDLVRELAEVQKRTEQRLDRLDVALAELAEAQRNTGRQLTELVEAQNRTEQAVSRLAEGLQKANDRIADLMGWKLERQYYERAGAYLGRWLRPVEALSLADLRETLEARLDQDAVEDIMRLDVLIRGRARHVPGNPEVWLAMEVSHAVDRADVERAQRRAALLRKAGYRAIPVVAGEWLTEGAEAEAQVAPILILQDGHARGWEAALAAAQA